MSIFPQNYTVKDVKSLQQTFSDQNSRRQRYTVTYNRLNKDNSALANEFKNTFNVNQYNENERKAFLAKL
jgi:phage protein U